MNLLQSNVITNLLASELPKLFRAIPELVAAVNRLSAEIKELRETLEKEPPENE